ncbi:hypothetical protein S7711_06583 [Stachybotrys chartarum IBT 7711]|uniref:DUF6546 domain-containing protein n=1 Tax=Stachybotrys chartarum (strain CBS 109288 / IBT 7711) TaxID=1280523 RepID=A0A084AYN6_STACB|nr:hypothetical protein S7711_06583 [Stachybotrys chartarum IBT 7711]
MRLQTQRRWLPQTVTHILSHLSSLREFHYEPWRHWFTEMQEMLDEYTSSTRAPNVLLGQKLARVNLTVKALSASFMVDAEDFFSVLPSTWPNLTYLTLTSQLLAPKTCPTKIMDLFQAAASAACYMPKLKTMEIWNGLGGLAAVFKFEFIPGYLRPSVITWRATWNLTLQYQVTKAWEEVIRGRDSCSDGIDVVYESVEPEEIMSHADAVASLKLSEMVIRPVSLQQIMREQSFLQSMVV